MGAKQHSIRAAVTCADDPVLILKSEHATLLGQLHILERQPLPARRSCDVLRTLIRDSHVHFNREELLYRALSPKVGTGKTSLEPLNVEHRQLRRKAKQLLGASVAKMAKTHVQQRAKIRSLSRELTRHFVAHIEHEETVVYVLARTRLGPEERKRLASRMLSL